MPFPTKMKIAMILKCMPEIIYTVQCLSRSFLPGWLEDAALFAAIDRSIDALSWYEWPEPLKNRHLRALEDIYQKQKDFVSISNYNIFIAMNYYRNKCQWTHLLNLLCR